MGVRAKRALRFFKYACINYLNSSLLLKGTVKTKVGAGVRVNMGIQKIDAGELLLLVKASKDSPANLLLPRLTGRGFQCKLQ